MKIAVILLIFGLVVLFASLYLINKADRKAPGPYEVEVKSVYIGGFVCHFSQEALVYYPKNTQDKFPLLSFSHGFLAGGIYERLDYAPLLFALSSFGYVVIAPKSAPLNYCQQETHDQLRAIQAAQQSNDVIFTHIDWSYQVGLIGHSMGGQATVESASSDQVQQLNIGAAVALSPVDVSGANVKVPIFYGTGTGDIQPQAVKVMYDASPPPKVLADLKNALHTEPTVVGTNKLSRYYVAFFECFLKKNQSECNLIFGNNSQECDLCTCSKYPMKICEYQQ